ncbi:ORF6N domain-containing protein [Cedecea sp.]|jgi:hypothetical protein|uniref:ORF6N domain-containing protein n=1 Tax=Cedecea sp. TaxID=1970739 RepID=UPI002F42237E
MTTQISAESISLTVHQNTPVITTELLALLYDTGTDNIKKNYARNQERFSEGKHFYKVAGDELKNLRETLSHSQNSISPKTRSLILWTERGAARHAKMLETDQAWDVFEKLEDCYFNQKNSASLTPLPAKPNSYDTRTLCYKRAGVTVNELPLREDDLIISLESWLDLARKNGWVVLRRDEAIVTLTEKIGGLMEEIFSGYTQAMHKYI